MDPSKLMLTALRFNERINQQDPEGLAELMTDDHAFVDSEGNITKGKDAMIEGWRHFFEKYPDYRNKFTSVTIQDNVVVIVGYSTCSYKPLDVQTCGLPKYMGNVSPDGECTGWTKGTTKIPTSMRALIKNKIRGRNNSSQGVEMSSESPHNAYCAWHRFSMSCFHSKRVVMTAFS